jgi:platelet-activating factor acetylhydrolase IB subunit alpha
VSTSADMSAKLWDMSSFQCTKTLRGHDHTISCAVFAPSGDNVFTGARDQTIKCWEVSSGFSVKTYNGHTEWVKGLAISADGTTLASGSSDHSVIVWRVDTGAQIQVMLDVVGCVHLKVEYCVMLRFISDIAGA